MTTVIAFDTETTGFPSSKKALTDPTQPHLVSLSALKCDVETRRVIQSISLIVRPDGWEIPQVVVDIHGISTEIALAEGHDEKLVLSLFLALWEGKHLRVAHKADFDKQIIATSIARCYGEGELLSKWIAGEDFCTMQASKELVDARTVKGAKKLPNLHETYEFFFHEGFSNQHSANADAVAVWKIFLALREMGQ